MTTSYLSRAQFDGLCQALNMETDHLKVILENRSIYVDETPVDPARISSHALYCMAWSHGNYIATDFAADDMEGLYPWLTRAEAEQVAATAADYFSDNANASEAKSYAIEGAMRLYEHPDYPEGWKGSHVDSDGKVWTYNAEDDVLECSDGRAFERDCSDGEWLELKPELPAGLKAALEAEDA